MKSPKSKTLSPDLAGRLGQMWVSLTALAVVTCAGASHPVLPNAATTTPNTAAPPAKPSGSALAVAASFAPPNGAVLGAPSNDAKLVRFKAALDELASGKRKEPVRVLWLGDSHTAADFWSDAFRKPLQDRFGAGGPGFIFAGLRAYRHSNVKLERGGRWRVEPRQPSLWMRQDDGVFGLGGMRAVPMDASARAAISLAADAIHGNAHWDLSFRLPSASARFRVHGDGFASKSVDGKAFPVGTIAHLEWQSKAPTTVVIDSAEGSPEILGIVAEATTPGVVLDTLGINGARIGTPLAWEEQPWLAEAERRHASLFVMAYGTNEVGDQVAPPKYADELEALVARVRKAAPDADCIVAGPTDRAAPDWTTLPRVSEIDAVERQTAERVGCAFFSAWETMGGDGGLKRWADMTPPFAGSDHVHLTARGYAELGSALLKEVFGESRLSQANAQN